MYLRAMPAQMVVRAQDLVERRDLEGDMVEIGIRRRLLQRADECDAVVIGVAAQETPSRPGPSPRDRHPKSRSRAPRCKTALSVPRRAH